MPASRLAKCPWGKNNKNCCFRNYPSSLNNSSWETNSCDSHFRSFFFSCCKPGITDEATGFLSFFHLTLKWWLHFKFKFFKFWDSGQSKCVRSVGPQCRCTGLCLGAVPDKPLSCCEIVELGKRDRGNIYCFSPMMMDWRRALVVGVFCWIHPLIQMCSKFEWVRPRATAHPPTHNDTGSGSINKRTVEAQKDTSSAEVTNRSQMKNDEQNPSFLMNLSMSFIRNGTTQRSQVSNSNFPKSQDSCRDSSPHSYFSGCTGNRGGNGPIDELWSWIRCRDLGADDFGCIHVLMLSHSSFL